MSFCNELSDLIHLKELLFANYKSIVFDFGHKIIQVSSRNNFLLREGTSIAIVSYERLHPQYSPEAEVLKLNFSTSKGEMLCLNFSSNCF
jgi:hypothetical protein